MIDIMSHLQAVGCNIQGCDCDGNVSWVGEPNESLAALVWAAHEQPLISTECLALQAAITNERWLAYVDCRKAPIRAQREQRYRSETDALRLKADGDNEIGSEAWDTAIAAWKLARQAIKDALPYSE